MNCCNNYQNCNCNTGNLSENNDKLKRELGDFVDLLRERVSDIAYDKNYENILNSIADVKLDLNNAIDESLDIVNTAKDEVNTAVAAIPFEDGVLSDTFIDVDGSLSQRTINKGLESVDDLTTINNPKDGLRVYVKSYIAGLGKGGGYFTYDSDKASINNQGTIIDGWVREPQSYIDMHSFGGDLYTGDPLEALQAAIDNALPSGTVSMQGFTGLKVFDSQIDIDKPLTVLGNRESLQLKLKDQSNLFHSTGATEGQPWGTVKGVVLITHSHVVFEDFDFDFNHLNNYTTIEGVRYYFNEEPEINYTGYTENRNNTEWRKDKRKSFRYLRSINVSGALSNVVIRNNKLIGNSVHAIGVSGAITMGSSRHEDIPDLNKPELYARNILIEGNYISDGCRSGIYFIGGVINSVMRNNTAYNWGWAAYRVYYQTNNCIMEYNNCIVDADKIDVTHYENTKSDYLPGIFAVGYRIGHRQRNPGSCANTHVRYNNFTLTGEIKLDKVGFLGYKALRIEWLSKDNFIYSNTFNEAVSNDISFNALYPQEGLCVIQSSHGVYLKGNKVSGNRKALINISPNGNEIESNKILIEGNDFDSENTVHIHLDEWEALFEGTARGTLEVVNNSFRNLNYSGVLAKKAVIKNFNVLNNAFYDVDLVDITSTMSNATIYPVSNTFNIIKNNTIICKKGHALNYIAVKQTSISNGITQSNTVLVDEGYVPATAFFYGKGNVKYIDNRVEVI